jgi:hypothetical protein
VVSPLVYSRVGRTLVGLLAYEIILLTELHWRVGIIETAAATGPAR